MLLVGSGPPLAFGSLLVDAVVLLHFDVVCGYLLVAGPETEMKWQIKIFVYSQIYQFYAVK